jgi:ATP-dependent helicase HrpA
MPSDQNIESRIETALQADRHRLLQQLRSIRRARQAGKPFDRNLGRLTEDIARSVALREARRAALPRVEFSDDLPIAARRQEIAAAIVAHQAIVVCGETGSGKSTQLPKICLELGRGVDGLIGHTQPRRIAARSVAARIAEELHSPLGHDVGYKVRFSDATHPRTYVKLMTDGILLAESQHDRFLNQYDTIIVDEAHERSLNIDFLLGYLKRLLGRRPELRLIVTSATIDAQRFARHFSTPEREAPVIEVSGRAYPVEVRYRPPALPDDAAEPDLLRGVLDAVSELAALGDGDMLIFMPTEQHIHATAKALRGRTLAGDAGLRQTEIVPLYARLPTAEQQKVFKPHANRRIVIATNVAESSLTVPGIRYVIDTGTARISRYSSRSKVRRLPIEPISQASADQRTGRCGRVGPGVCVRLFSEEDYLSRDRYTVPEIQRSNLAAVILQAKSLGLGEIDDFPFLDPPRPESVRDGFNTLFELAAIDEHNRLTELGRTLSRIPADPRIARLILAAAHEGCLHEVLIIAAALEVQDPRDRPHDRQQAADEAHTQFADEQSDFLSYLKMWDFVRDVKGQLSRSQFRKACRDNFLSFERVREWLEVHRQLVRITAQAGLAQHKRRDDYDAIHRALLTGFLSSVALRGEGPTSEYDVAGGQKAHLWPGSGTFAHPPKWLMAAEMIETSRRYLRCVAKIQRSWIEELAPHLIKRTHHDPGWEQSQGAAMIFENVLLYGLRIVHRRRVRLAGIDARQARELLILQGLVRGNLSTRAKFFEHNQQLLADMQQLQRRSRRSQLLRGEDDRYEFYDQRIPADVVDGRSFELWRREVERGQPRLLYMTEADLLAPSAGPVDPAEYPDALFVRSMRLPLDYHHEPNTERDGITISVPREGFSQLDPKRLDWLVPGLIPEKVTALIKSLPKDLRRKLIPAADTAQRVVQEIGYGDGSFAWAVARALSKIAGESIPPDAFAGERLSEYLRMRIRVVDAAGRTLAIGRDLALLRQQLWQAGHDDSSLSDAEWIRQGITAWDFGDLPERVEHRHGEVLLAGYPAVVDRQTSVGLELAASAAQAAYDSRSGIRRLFALAAAKQLETQVEWLPNLNQLLLWGATLPATGGLRTALADLIADRAFLADDRLPRTQLEFADRLAAGRERLGLTVQEVIDVVRPLLEAYHQARLALETATNPQWKYATADATSQLDELTRPGFLCATPWRWLCELPRYFRAIRARLEKLSAGGLEADEQRFALLHPRWQSLLERLGEERAQRRYDVELHHYRWLLEEYRVSLFAQQLGTSLPVSDKRLDRQWERVGKDG